MRTLLTFLILGALITGVSNLHAQQRTGEPNSRPVPLPPQAQKRSIPQFPIPYPEQSEEGRQKHGKVKSKVRGWQRPNHPGRGHAYGRGKKVAARTATQRLLPTVVRRRNDRQTRRLPRRVTVPE